MSVATICYNEDDSKWLVYYMWVGSPKQFNRAEDAIEWCKINGKLISWM